MAREPVIRNAAGVCSAEEDTRILARVSAAVAPPAGRALDLGTGTGYIAIYLAACGLQVDASDVSRRALDVARENAARNGVTVRVIESDLFAAAAGPYDLIVFNPPMNPRESELTRLLTSFLRRHRTVARLMMGAFDRFLDSSRMPFLLDFLAQAETHLAAGGHIVLELTRLEIDELTGRLPELEFSQRTDIPRLPTEQVVVVRRRAEVGA